MEISRQIRLQFHGVDVISIQFNTQQPYSEGIPVDLTVSPKVFYPKDDNRRFNIIMEVKVACRDYFDLSTVSIGYFDLNEALTPELKGQFVNANAPAIMFPYVRAFITTLTSAMGNSMKPIILPTQFFTGELEEVNLSVLQPNESPL